jgi:hypothetical protein
MMAFYLEIASLENGGGWRSVGNAIGKSGAYARQLATGKRPVTKKVAAAWASKSGWVCKTVEVPSCPDCGSVHHARCNGHAGAVVVLAAGETVRKPGQSRQRPHYYRPCLPVDLGEQVKLHGINVEALLTQAVKSAIVDAQWRERTHEV